MGLPYNGIGDNVSQFPAVSISSSTNATPIVVTTSTPHNLTEGDEILISSHSTNLVANGIWYAHILSSTTVALLVPVTHVASVGTAVGGGGTLQSQGLSPTFTEPSGTDLRSASSVNTGLSALADRTAWLGQRIGIYKTISWTFQGPFDQTEPPGTLGTVTTGSYAVGNSFTALTVPSQAFIAGDILVFRGQMNVEFATGATGAGFVFKPQLFYNSSTNDFSTAPHVTVEDNSTSSIAIQTTVGMNFAYTLPANTAFFGSIAVVINGRQTLGGNSATVYNSSVFELQVIRAN